VEVVLKTAAIITFTLFLCLTSHAFESITFPSLDSLLITADVYIVHDNTAPFIVLFHQAGYSRGEYREIAPKLNEMGFNALAIDQRSGKVVNSVVNQTALRAVARNLPHSYLDALTDLKAAIDYARTNYAAGKLIIWGSSYSAALVLKIAGDQPGLVDGVLAFSPGEYFLNFGKSDTFITRSAANIEIPVFITSAADEKDQWWSIFQSIPAADKFFFIPAKEGKHGSKALWESSPEHQSYWQTVRDFLDRYVAGQRPSRPAKLREIE